MKFLLKTLCLTAIFAPAPLFANPDIKEVSIFSDILQIAETLNQNNWDKTLFVFDDDDTLTQMACPSTETCQYLGGPAWYAWQESLLNDKTAEFQSEDDLIDASALLLALNKMVPTDADMLQTLTQAVDQGAGIMVLTARGLSEVSATETQLGQIKNDDTDPSMLDLFREHAPITQQAGIASKAGPYALTTAEYGEACETQRNIAYQQGVMYAVGQNKGMLLRCAMLNDFTQTYEYVVFLDDTFENVRDVVTAFKHGPATVAALYYTKLAHHKKELTTGGHAADYQAAATQRWDAIEAAMKAQLLLPQLPE